MGRRRRPTGRLRTDDQAVRFVEVTVNGPKTWSLAAALHDDVAAAYDAAQLGAAEEIIAWLAAHATTRVGPRGRQVQVPVEAIEAAVVRHFTSRAGDPHRHLHVQINARVSTRSTTGAREWRGLHTVGARDSLEAINGIGHAAVMTHPDRWRLDQLLAWEEKRMALAEAALAALMAPDWEQASVTDLLPQPKRRRRSA